MRQPNHRGFHTGRWCVLSIATAVLILGALATAADDPKPAAQLYGKSDETGSSPKENPVHPTELLATIYYALGIDPGQMVLNDLGQPRELVKGAPLVKLFS